MPLNKTEALRHAQQFALQGNLTSAINVYEKLVAADPSDLAALSALSDLYVKANRAPEAIRNFSHIAESCLERGSAVHAAYYLKKALEIEPSNAPVRMRLGEIYSHEGLTEKAHEAFVQAGVAFRQSGNLAEAMAANQQALAIKSDSQPAAEAIIVLQREMAQQQSKPAPSQVVNQTAPNLLPGFGAQDAKRASQSLNDPSSHPSNEANFSDEQVIERISRAELLVAYGQVEDAVAMLKKVLQQRPADVNVHIKLKDIYLRSEMIKQAAEECLEISRIYAARGDAERARDYVVRAQRLNPASNLESHEQQESSALVRTAPFSEAEPRKVAANQPAQPSAEVAVPAQPAQPSTQAAASAKESAPRQQAQQSAEATVPAQAVQLVTEAALSAPPAQPPAPVAVTVAPLTESRRPVARDEMPMPVVKTEDRAATASGSTTEALSESASHPLNDTATAATNEQPHSAFASAAATNGKPRKRLYAVAVAAGLLAVAAGVAIPMYKAHLNQGHEVMAQAEQSPTLPALPSPAPEQTQPEAAPAPPVEQIEVRASDSPSTEPEKPARVEKDRPERNVTEAPNAEPPVKPAPEPVRTITPPNANKPAAPAPPVIASAPNAQGGTENGMPRSMSAGLPRNATGMPEPPPPPTATTTTRKQSTVTPSQSVQQVQPDYPQLAKSARQSGVVTVEVSINERGEVTSARAVSGSPLLREAAVSAVRRWKFKPAMRDGKPISSVTTVSFNFKL